jgi:hypothetical protein
MFLFYGRWVDDRGAANAMYAALRRKLCGLGGDPQKQASYAGHVMVWAMQIALTKAGLAPDVRGELDRVAEAAEQLRAALQDMRRSEAHRWLQRLWVQRPRLEAELTELATAAREPLQRRRDAEREFMVQAIAHSWGEAGKSLGRSWDNEGRRLSGPFVRHLRDVFQMVGVKPPGRDIIERTLKLIRAGPIGLLFFFPQHRGQKQQRHKRRIVR